MIVKSSQNIVDDENEDQGSVQANFVQLATDSADSAS